MSNVEPDPGLYPQRALPFGEFKRTHGGLDLVQILISGLQLPNFVFYCINFFAESPTFDCKMHLVKNKIFSVLPQHQNLNMR
jgi:hypothetical protein